MTLATKTAQNIIFTGVAGTGKTHHLQQLAKQYSETLNPTHKQAVINTLIDPLNWREVVCLVFLQQRQQGQELLKVADIISHEFFVAKASINKRTKNLKETVWSTLQRYSPSNSSTVNYKDKASQSYFNKDDSSNWYLLTESLPLLQQLQQQLADYLDDSQLYPSATIDRFSFVSFHQNYGYDEFVEGVRPVIEEQSGHMRYRIESGAFLKLCQKAQQDPEHRYVMLIDEINRANVSQVFGELMTLIEPSKRMGQASAISVQLAYSGKQFSVPNNIDIFATMNSQDHSLVTLDSAFRRRFEFIEMLPDASILPEIKDAQDNSIFLGKVLTGLNQRISETLGEEYQLGHAYFCQITNTCQLLNVMLRQVIPQLINHSKHNPQALEYILATDTSNWLTVKNTAHSNTASTHINAHYHQNYQINPKLQQLLQDIQRDTTQLDNQITDNKLLSHQSFTALY